MNKEHNKRLKLALKKLRIAFKLKGIPAIKKAVKSANQLNKAMKICI